MAARASGILLHLTSLPGAHGVGDLGPAARRFVDWLAEAGQSLWQVLPLGPAAPGGSPYGAGSAFAGEPLLISLEDLAADGLLEERSLGDAGFEGETVDHEAARDWKERRLRAAWRRFRDAGAGSETAVELERFCAAPEQAVWLEDWALYAALKARFDGRPWYRWPEPIRRRLPGATRRAHRELASEIAFQRFAQFLFARQWRRLRRRARERGVALFGDLPLYPSPDSADVWSHPELFDLDEAGRPRRVAGVPPDYYSTTGQRWGNPLYLWDRLRADGFAWWVERLRCELRRFDLLRVDHFRGLAAYWEVPAEAATAEHGRWRPGPGRELFDAARTALGELPLVAEDLGTITPDVHRLRDELGIPGMRVLQFAFDGLDNHHLPHRLQPNVVVYTGTHDNDASRGWFESADEATRRRVLDYLGAEPDEIHWALARAALTSVAERAVLPLQDVLGLGSEARMNLPGQAEGNWRWRFRWRQLTPATGARLRRLTEVAGRLPAERDPT